MAKHYLVIVASLLYHVSDSLLHLFHPQSREAHQYLLMTLGMKEVQIVTRPIVSRLLYAMATMRKKEAGRRNITTTPMTGVTKYQKTPG